MHVCIDLITQRSGCERTASFRKLSLQVNLRSLQLESEHARLLYLIWRGIRLHAKDCELLNASKQRYDEESVLE